jgi:hypothetical protein
MSNPLFEIGAPGVSTEKIVEEIRATVARKTAEGVYADPRVGRAEKRNLANLKDEDSFINFYLESLRDAVFVDINDFEIRERRPVFGALLVAFKRGIWKMLKFYTYRLWSQQNEINGLLLTATEEIEGRYRDRIKDLEARIVKLEAQIKG